MRTHVPAPGVAGPVRPLRQDSRRLPGRVTFRSMRLIFRRVKWGRRFCPGAENAGKSYPE